MAGSTEPGRWVHFIEWADRSGAWYIFRHENHADTLEEAQRLAVEGLSDARSIPTGADGVLKHLESVPFDAIVRRTARRRDVPLFELEEVK